MMDALSSGHDAVEAIDPRIRRSRRMLGDALATLLTTKDFDKISIQDIAETATLNRATFYDHYPDKFALLECVVGSRFSQLLAMRHVQVEDCAGALRAIGLGVCDYLAEVRSNGVKSHAGSLQSAIVGVIRGMLLEGLHERVYSGNVSSDVVASIVAWAIYGAANAWVQNPQQCSAEHMADIIDRLVKPMLLAATEAGDDHRPSHLGRPARGA